MTLQKWAEMRRRLGRLHKAVGEMHSQGCASPIGLCRGPATVQPEKVQDMWNDIIDVCMAIDSMSGQPITIHHSDGKEL